MLFSRSIKAVIPRAAHAVATASARSATRRRPIQTTSTTRKSMPITLSNEQNLASKMPARHLDAAACTVELEIALSKGQIKQEEFLQTVEMLTNGRTVAATSASSESSTVAADLYTTRTSRMAEVTASKIFFAGFGWQLASTIAANNGLASNSLAFFAATGLGDCLGVFLGHMGYKLLMRADDMKKEAQIATHLGSAAAVSGFTWQPTLNALQALDCSFNECMLGVGSACTLAFFVGLRVFRQLYSTTLAFDHVEKNNYANLKSDVGLSIAIGGASAAFVGTDVSFGTSNYLMPLVGIHPDPSMSTLGACAVAGSSTALGFVAMQTAQNTVLPKGKNWID